MSDEVTWVLTASNMPDCVASAAFAQVVFGYTPVFVPHTTEFNKIEDVFAALHDCRKNDILFIIGSFWKNSLKLLSDYFANVKIYAFGDEIKNDFASNINIYRDISKRGAIDWIYNVSIGLDNSRQELVKSFMNSNKEILDKCNKRCFGAGDYDVQVLFTGVYALAENGNLFQVFVDLFTHTINYNDVISRGKMLIENHQQIAAERARKNSKLVTLRNGKKAIMTEGPELINFTHEALMKHHKEAEYTIVVRYQFAPDDNTDDKLCLSIRTINPSNNAMELLLGCENAGGSNTAAGGQINTKFDLHL